jgi:sugar O-acyltransferase (sialic acid O-acetyltransferase NeuD family)
LKPLILIGDGGHASVLLRTAYALGREVLGVTSLDLGAGAQFEGIHVLGPDDIVENYPVDEIELINGIGSTDLPRHRENKFTEIRKWGYHFATLVHPRAIICEDVEMEEGVQVAAGAIIQTKCRLGANTIINTGTVLDHHCRVGAHCHLAPGVVCCGGVRIGNRSHIGSGSTVIQGVSIGADVLVAAGSVVIQDVHDLQRVKGSPAKVFQK